MTQSHRRTPLLIMIAFQLFTCGEIWAQAVTVYDDSNYPASLFEYTPPKPPEIPSDPTASPGFATSSVTNQFETLRVYRNGLVESVRQLTLQLQEESERLKSLQLSKSILDSGLRLNNVPIPSKDDLIKIGARFSEQLRDVQGKISAATSQPIPTSQMTALKAEEADLQRQIDQTQQTIETWQSKADEAIRLRTENQKQATDAAKLVVSVGELVRSNVELLNRLNNSLSNADIKISSLFGKNDATNDFKKIMSITFAMLVATVIIGFFVIAARDENIRRAIFTNESGIQFITLFALVIAIILFGIVNVLEGKELSALLGGLSGYILGRGTTRTT